MTAETITPKNDDVAPCDHQRQLDHIDEMCHRIMPVIEALEPHLPRLVTLLDPGAAMRRTFGRKNAVPQRTPAPVHVGEAPSDSGPVGT